MSDVTEQYICCSLLREVSLINVWLAFFFRNIETQFVFTSSKDEFWFCGITWQLEMNAVPGIKVRQFKL